MKISAAANQRGVEIFQTHSFPADLALIADSDPLIEVLPDNRVVIGYLVKDEDCEDPVNSKDGMGKILNFPEDKEDMLFLLGFSDPPKRTARHDPYAVLLWSLDLEPHYHSLMTEKLASETHSLLPNHSLWIPDTACLERIEARVYARQIPSLRIAREDLHNKRGEVIERNAIVWDLSDGRKRGGCKSFVHAAKAAARAAGVKLDRSALYRDVRDISRDFAFRAALERNKWLNGECYELILEVFSAEGVPQGKPEFERGFVGRKYAEKKLKESMRHLVARLQNGYELKDRETYSPVRSLLI